MYDLPKRESEIVVEIRGGEVKLVMEPLTDEEFFRLSETADERRDESDPAKSVMIYRLSDQPELFGRKLRRVEGVNVDGAEFDPKNPDHIARLPQNWKLIALGRAIRYANGLTETERGNSKQPAGSSTEEETHS